MVNHAVPPAMVMPVTIRLRIWRLAILAGGFTIIVLLAVIPFAGDGQVLKQYSSKHLTQAMESAMLDDYNSYSGYVATLIETPLEFVLQVVLPVIFLSLASNQHIQTEQPRYVAGAFSVAGLMVPYLVKNGFNAANVQAQDAYLNPRISRNDLKMNTDALDVMFSKTTNATQQVYDGYLPYHYNYITNTPLRNVLAPLVLKEDPVCSNSGSYVGQNASHFVTGMIQTYGFPSREWQSTMLPTNQFVHPTYCVVNGDPASACSNTTMLMNASVAANLFIHTWHVARTIFRWFPNDTLAFNVSNFIQDTKTPDTVSSPAEAQRYSVSAAQLFNMLPPPASDEDETEWFLDVSNNMFHDALSTGVDISEKDSTMLFSHTSIWGNITYDALTIQIPLRRNFYYRKLILSDDGDKLVEDTAATALFSNRSNADMTDDIYYDLDISSDCGSSPNLCVMPRVLEYDYYGNEYQPLEQIKITAICMNENRTEDFQIDYSYYRLDENAANAFVKDVYWACNGKTSTSMYITSLGSRITGDNFTDQPAPDSTITKFDSERATLKNPRKYYTLTVGRLGWEFFDLAYLFNATCDEGVGQCRGIEYLMDIAVNGSFANAAQNLYTQFIVAGEDEVPVKDKIHKFEYNQSDGYETDTPWVSLMTLTTPTSDEKYTQKGDVLFWYNFGNTTWESAHYRSGNSCSSKAEDYLNHVVSNHFYQQNEMQPSYTAGMYFIFQNGVVHNIVNITAGDNTSQTLAFQGNEQIRKLVISIPATNRVMTVVGMAIVLVGTLLIIITTRRGQLSLVDQPERLTAAMVLEMMLSDDKYPAMLLERRFENAFQTDESGAFEDFTIQSITLCRKDDGVPFVLPKELVKPDFGLDDFSSVGLSPLASHPYVAHT